MLSISINHPDIEEFITKKQDLTKVTGANVSVKVTNEFMEAVKSEGDYILRYPVNKNIADFTKEYADIEYNKLYNIKVYKDSKEVIYVKKIKARELWNKLIKCTWNTAEPGIIFEDIMHDYAPDGVYANFKMVSTNPCGK